jgi:DNA-binding protein YbaB
MVVARANGKHQLLSIRIEPELLEDPEQEMLQDLVVAAVNQAMKRAGEVAQQEMAKISGGLGFQLPGGFFG